MTLKDFITPALTTATLVIGMAYSSGLRDEKVNNINSSYQEMKIEVEKLRASVDRLNESMIRLEARDHQTVKR